MSKKRIYIIGGVVVFLIILILIASRPKAPAYSFIEVKRGDVVQEVSATGRVKPVEDVDLAFVGAGKVSYIGATVGSKVVQGQVLVRLDSSDLAAQLAGAEATLKSQEAKLAELKKGTRPEEIQIQEVTVANAATALDDAKNSLTDSLTDAFTYADDAIRNKIDQFFTNPKSANPLLSFVMSTGQLKIDIESGRLQMETLLNNWKILVDGIGPNSNLDAIDAATNENLTEVKLFLDNVALAVNALLTNVSLSQTTIDTYKASVATARTNINTAISGLTTAYESYRAARSALALAQNQLALEKAGTVPEQITAQEALVEKARADVDNYNAQIAKTILRSPISGIVTKQDAKLGEIAAVGVALVSVISDQNFEIEVNVPESDIAKISVGDSAQITLDAYGSDTVFGAHVVSIDPGETLVEGVATYKTTLQFDKKEDMVKSGMTANIDILANKKSGVLYIPQRALVDRDGERVVLVEDVNGKMQDKPVETGLKGSDGNVEIVSGLVEGDKIINAANL